LLEDDAKMARMNGTICPLRISRHIQSDTEMQSNVTIGDCWCYFDPPPIFLYLSENVALPSDVDRPLSAGCYPHIFTLTPRCKLYLRSSGMLHSSDWEFSYRRFGITYRYILPWCWDL